MQLRLAVTKRVTDVKVVDQYPIYELGAALQRVKATASSLTDASDPRQQARGDASFALLFAEHHLQSLLNGGALKVSYCLKSASALLADIQALYQSVMEQDSRVPLGGDWRWNALLSDINVFEHQFSAELKQMSVYAVPRRGIYDTALLIDSADGHLPDPALERSPEFVRSEFKAAGRCLAFGLFSASAFHALRAAERALKQYYIAFLGEPKKQDMTMGLMTSHLRDRVNLTDLSLPKPEEETLRTIGDVVSFDRNPLTHREMDLEEIDALLLFNRAQGMISMMVRELVKREDELSPELPLLVIENEQAGEPRNALTAVSKDVRAKAKTS